MEVKKCLQKKQVQAAKQKVAMIVGRDIDSYNEDGLARATVETVAENLVDGVTAPLFFAAIGGAPLALAYKMINTLDSMVGYKNDTYLLFGKASAKIDDVFNYIPARLTVPVVALAAQILARRGERGALGRNLRAHAGLFDHQRQDRDHRRCLRSSALQ
jgi:adenosylcobinamide-phosphate synthase